MRYIVATAVGGIMEQPNITYEDHQVIEAESERQAESIYDKINNCSYFYGKVVGTQDKGVKLHSEPTVHNSFV